MDTFLDRVWGFVEIFLNNAVLLLSSILAPFEFLGPGVIIFILAFTVVIITRVIAKFYVTKRYIKLKKQFKHWHGIREEAMKQPDKKKGKALTKNIDQAQLNRAYYDYFFEGLLKNFITNVLPILLMVAYITRVYTPEALFRRFGEKFIFSFSFGSASKVAVSSLLWFIICLLFSFILFTLLKWIIKKQYAKKTSD